LIGWIFHFCLSLFLEIGLKHAWTVYLVLSDVLCTFGCTLYFHCWKYKVHRKVHHYVGINIFSTGNKKGYKVHLKYIYVLLDVLCTFDCTLYFQMYAKEYKMYVRQCKKTQFNFLKKWKTFIMHMQIFCMSSSISSRVHAFPKVRRAPICSDIDHI
jgi:hypothetical protein